MINFLLLQNFPVYIVSKILQRYAFLFYAYTELYFSVTSSKTKINFRRPLMLLQAGAKLIAYINIRVSNSSYFCQTSPYQSLLGYANSKSLTATSTPRLNDTVRHTTVTVGTEIWTVTSLKLIRMWLYCHSIWSSVNASIYTGPSTVTIRPYKNLF